MKLKIENIGKIKQANIDLSSITVVTGVNGTGKSTIAKSLYTIFNSFYNISRQVDIERKTSIENLARAVFDMSNLDTGVNLNERRKFIKEVVKDIYDEEHIKELALSQLKDEDDVNNFLEKYKTRLSIQDKKILYSIIQSRARQEFNNQINNIYNKDEKGIISLKIKDNKFELEFKEQILTSVINCMSLDKECIYIDDFKEIENIDIFRRFFSKKDYNKEIFSSHTDNLYRKLIQSKSDLVKNLVTSKEIDRIFDQVFENTFSDIDVYRNDKYNESEHVNLRNIADGLKNFVVMKYLIEDEDILDRGVLILDEPEVHLHPEWQLKLAELIVLINKNFRTHILINTHSPYFLNAIEVYTRKYSIDEARYYLSELDGIVYDVTDNLEEAYLKLARPLQILEDLENEYY